MLIKFEDPTAVSGMLEDINTSYIDPGSVVSVVHDQIRRIQGGEGTYEQLYRTFNKHLRAIAASNSPYKEQAQGLLKRLPLLQTLPFGELEAPDYLDEYTGIEDKREWWKTDDDLSDKEEEVVNDGSKLSAAISSWNHYLVHRQPYASDKDNRAFLNANIEWTGLDEIEYVCEDRGYVPAHFNTEGQTDKDLGLVFGQCSNEIDALRERINEAVITYTPAMERRERGTFERLRFDVTNSAAGIDFLQRLQSLVVEHNPANVASVFLRYQHGYAFDLEHASTIILPDNTTLQDYIEMYEDELLSSVDACGPMIDDSMTDDEIKVEIDLLYREYINNIEEHSKNPRHSRAWVAGFINAVESGTPLRRTENITHTAVDAAWENWRVTTSPEGDAVYRTAIRNGATRRVAMRCFYSEARKRGQVHQNPKRIKGIRKYGLVLTNNKVVNWGVAGKIDNEEGFDMNPADRSRLKGILVDKGWGGGFVERL